MAYTLEPLIYWGLQNSNILVLFYLLAGMMWKRDSLLHLLTYIKHSNLNLLRTSSPVFLESPLSESFPSLGVTGHLTSLGCPLTLRWSLDLLWGSSASTLVLLLCVLPSMSAAIRTNEFSLVGALSDLLYIPQTQGLPGWSCGFNLQLVQLVVRF